jgi:hypothetical protein
VVFLKFGGKWNVEGYPDAHVQRIVVDIDCNRSTSQRNKPFRYSVVLSLKVITEAGMNKEKSPLPVFQIVTLR